jgi:hypothetical protein
MLEGKISSHIYIYIYITTKTQKKTFFCTLSYKPNEHTKKTVLNKGKSIYPFFIILIIIV